MFFGRRAQPRRPVLAHQLVVGADPAGGDDHGLRLAARTRRPRTRELRLPARDGARLEHMPGDPGDGAGRDGQLVDPVAEAQLDQAALLGLAHAAHERLDHAGAGAPGDVEARHRVAVAGGEIAAALGPADVRHEAHALRVQPRALLAGGEVDVGLGPAARPLVLGAVEPRRAQPVLPGQLARVVDPHPALLGAVDEEQARRTTRTPARRATPRAPGRAGSPGARRRRARRSRPGRPGRPRPRSRLRRACAHGREGYSSSSRGWPVGRSRHECARCAPGRARRSRPDASIRR